MRCERCGKEIDSFNMNVFASDGSDSVANVPIAEEQEEGAVVVETSSAWTGCGLSEEEQAETIKCPHCGAFPFMYNEVQTYDVVKVVCFKNERALQKTGCVEDNKLRAFATETFARKCYALYQYDWLSQRGLTLADVFDVLREAYDAGCANDGAGFTDLELYFCETGFDGELFVSEEEFCENEYQDASFMERLLPKEMYDEYLRLQEYIDHVIALLDKHLRGMMYDVTDVRGNNDGGLFVDVEFSDGNGSMVAQHLIVMDDRVAVQ